MKAWNAARATAAFIGVDLAATVFLMDDGAYNVKKGQAPVEGLREMDMAGKYRELIGFGVEVILCGTCQKARGIQDDELIDDVKIGTMIDMAKSVKESKVVISF